MKIKDNKVVMRLNFVQILKAMEQTKIDMDKVRLIPLLLDDEAKKDIDYQLIVNYRDGSNGIYLIWLKSEKVVIARKDNPKQKNLEHYIIKGKNAKQLSDLFKVK